MKEIYEILKRIRPEFDFENSSDFITDGLLDSFDVVSLVMELESTFNCTIDGLDIIPDNFDTVENIIKVIRKNGGVI